MKVEIADDGVTVDAEALSRLFDNLDAKDVQDLMREGGITSMYEKGTDQDEGRFRVSFLYDGTLLRLICSEDGTVVSTSKTRSPAIVPGSDMRRNRPG